jgi:signal transduction histidine kinase
MLVPLSMMNKQYKPMFLLLSTLMLPSLAIAWLGWKDFTREREKQLNDAEVSTKNEVRQQLLQNLERIKLQEISGAPADPSVVFTASVQRDRLLLPWDADPTAARFRDSIDEPDFARKILQAKRAEAAEKRYDQAAALYRDSIQEAKSEDQRIYARFLLAGALARSGKGALALSINRDLLKLSTSTVDENGVPFAYYAAQRMATAHLADHDVLDRLGHDVKALTSLPPHGIYVLKEVLEALRQSHDRMVVHDAEEALKGLTSRTATLEQAAALQRQFPSLHLRPAEWRPYRSSGSPDAGEWLVSLTPYGGESEPKVVVVKAAQIFAGVESRHLSGNANVPFQISTGDNGELLGEELSAFRIIFNPPGNTLGWTSIITQRPIYVLSLICVVVLTFAGGYLLWRDTQREIRLAELRTQFVSSVSHELKTPLTAIRMFAEIMQMQCPADREKHAEHLDTIVNESERLTRLLNNVLDFSRVERGQKHYNMQPTALEDVVKAAARTMRFPLAERGFEFQLSIDDGIPKMQVDRDALEQAILNLLSNAMKYSGQSRDVALRLSKRNGSAVIQVSDHGVGIPVKEQQRIFEKFYRVPTPENRTISGTGLGLALVAHITQAHHGRIQVESSPGKGSTFSIFLPISSESRS